MSSPACPYLLDLLNHKIPLDGDVLLLGRADDCDLVVADQQVSRHHAQLRRLGDGFLLVDLNSTNGTRLNGERVRPLAEPFPLRSGDVVELGSARFVYHDPEATLDTEHFPHLVLDEASGEVWVDRRPVSLSSQQHALLRLLWSRRGLPCSRDEIARAVWPECAGDIYDYQIESLVKRLRLKLEPDPIHPILLLTVRGRGYRLSPAAIS
jgi:DNA-binding response OmpR family regulator